MGVYLNPGKQLLLMALRSEINADSRGIFEKLKISGCEDIFVGDNTLRWDTYLEQFDVIRIVTTVFMQSSDSVRDMLQYLTDEVASELMEAYPDVHYGSRITLGSVMNKIFAKTGRQFVIIIDEWDAVFRRRKADKDGQALYLDFLRDMLKDKGYVTLAYMTGILPIKKYGEHSALNMFTEYSMIAPMQLAKYTGFTDGEVRELCDRHAMDYDAVSNWYDGYVVSDRIPEDKRKAYREGAYSDLEKA